MKSFAVVVGLLLSTVVSALDFTGPRLISYSLYQSISKEELVEKMKKNHVPPGLVKPLYDVDVYDIQYKSCWHDGTCIMASGLYFVPKGVATPLPQIVYHHGTRVEKGRKRKLGGEEFLCLGYVVDGYALLEPDYIGLGHGDKFHLYQNAASLGQASVDMLRAVHELDSILGIQKNNQLFLTGYSEGGYATLATHKLIEEKYAGEFKITASSANSGAYDMAGVQSKTMFNPYDHPHYLPYLLLGVNEVYQLIKPNINVVYKSPYDTLIPKMFDGSKDYRNIDELLPKVPKDMLLDSLVLEFMNNPDFPLVKVLKENSLIDWAPANPVQLCYCDKDEQVDYRNSIVAKKRMKELGAKHVTTRRAAKKYGHGKCAIFATMYSKLYFDSFRNGSKYGRKGNTNKRFLLSLAKLAIKP